MREFVRLSVSILRFLPDKRREMVPPITGMVISNIIALGVPILAMVAIDELRGKREIDALRLLVLLVAWFAALVIVGLLDSAVRVRLKRYSCRCLQLLHERMLRERLQFSYAEWQECNAKEQSAQMMNDLSAIAPVFAGTLFFLLRHGAVLIASTGLLIWVNWRLSVGVAVIIPAFFLGYVIWGRRLKVSYGASRQAQDSFTVFLVEFLQTIPLMKVFRTEEHEVRRVMDAYNSSLEQQLSYYRISNARQTYSKILASVAPVYLAFLAFFMLSTGLTTVGEIFAFWGVFAMLVSSIGGTTSVANTLVEAGVVWKRVRPALLRSLGSADLLPNVNSFKEIAVQDVRCQYNGAGRPPIEYPSFLLRAGEWVEIRAPSGTGKTTLLRMLLGLLDPCTGSILVDGARTTAEERRGLARYIGYVEQDGYLYSRSLKENILLGRKLDEKAWNTTTRMARLDDLLQKLEHGPDQLLGENGVQLSGGERQRILIARALYGAPKWMFLDEPFAGIDQVNQREIGRLIESLRGTLTVVLITHMGNDLVHCDRLIELSGEQSVRDVVDARAH